jgi:hypothetical protein
MTITIISTDSTSDTDDLKKNAKTPFAYTCFYTYILFYCRTPFNVVGKISKLVADGRPVDKTYHVMCSKYQN